MSVFACYLVLNFIEPILESVMAQLFQTDYLAGKRDQLARVGETFSQFV